MPLIMSQFPVQRSRKNFFNPNLVNPDGDIFAEEPQFLGGFPSLCAYKMCLNSEMTQVQSTGHRGGGLCKLTQTSVAPTTTEQQPSAPSPAVTEDQPSVAAPVVAMEVEEIPPTTPDAAQATEDDGCVFGSSRTCGNTDTSVERSTASHQARSTCTAAYAGEGEARPGTSAVGRRLPQVAENPRKCKVLKSRKKQSINW